MLAWLCRKFRSEKRGAWIPVRTESVAEYPPPGDMRDAEDKETLASCVIVDGERVIKMEMRALIYIGAARGMASWLRHAIAWQASAPAQQTEVKS